MSKDRATRMTQSGSRGREQSERWEERRHRFSDSRDNRAPEPRGLKPATLITIAGIALAVVIVAAFAFKGNTASAEVLQQAPSTTGSAEAGKVTVSVDEVKAKKIVYWDHKKADGKSTPLMAYVTPSGAVKVAVRLCEPCNGYSFRIEGGQIVCNSCGTRWDLETSKGISGGCQDYPPDVLPSTISDGKVVVEEAKVINWKPRP